MTYQLNAGAVRRYGRAMRFGAFLQALPGKLTPAPFRLMQIGSAFWQSRALYVAARLDIATRLGEETVRAEEIAVRVGGHADAIGRLLRLLAAIGVFEETAPRTFRNNAVSTFLRADVPDSVRSMILLHNSDAMGRPWYEDLENGVRNGVPAFRLTHGEDLFEYLENHAELEDLFSAAMQAVDALTGDSFVTDFDWGPFHRIIDIGGSHGAKSRAILRRHPAMTALVFDRPQVIATAEQACRLHHDGTECRMSFLAGDALAGVPAARDEKDIFLLAALLHGFEDAACLTILRTVAAACGQTGARIALMEMVLPEQGATVAEAACDMQMLMGTRGRERTLREWTALFAAAGLILEEVVALRSFGSILVLRPDTGGQGA